MNEEKSIKQTFAPMLRLNLLFGMGVLDLKPNRFNKILEYTYTASFLVLYNCITIWSTSSFKAAIQYESGGMYDAINISYSVAMNIMIIVSRINSQKLTRVLKLVDSWDRKTRNVGLTSQHHALLVYQIKVIILYAFFIASYNTVLYIDTFKDLTTVTKFKIFYLTLSQFILAFWISVFEISFVTWIKYFRLKFQQMNEVVRGMLTTTSDSPQHKREFRNKMFTSFKSERICGSNASADVIRAIKERHLELIKIATLMNASYGIQIVLFTTISFVVTITILYVTYTIMWMNLDSHTHLPKMIPFVYYILFNLWSIVYKNNVCAETCEEATEIGDIICELHKPSASKEFLTEIQDFTLQLIQNPLVFTGYGFFDLGHSFIQETIGSITMYLVILIQVGDMSIDFTDTTKNNNTENAI